MLIWSQKHKLYGLLFTFSLSGLVTWLTNYLYSWNAHTFDSNAGNLQKISSNKKFLKIFPQNFETSKFNPIFQIHYADHISLDINKEKFESLLKEMVLELIYSHAKNFNINLKHLSGKIFYYFIHDHQVNIYIQWHIFRAPNSITYYDYFTIKFKI